MATIYDLKLELLSHDKKAHIVKLRVSYKVRLRQVERSMLGLLFKETIKLMGADPGTDAFLYQFPTQYFATEADGVVVRSREAVLGSEVLDEDSSFFGIGGGDEVYARVTVSPLLPSGDARSSNEIHGDF
jgi:hypothetical protein